MKRVLSIILSVVIAMPVFTSCATADKALASTYLNLGEKYITDLNHEEAIVYFNKVIEVEPKNERAYLGMAEAYVAMGDIDSAISILEQGIEAVDDPTELQAMLEICYSMIKIATTAIYYYDSDGNVDSWREYEYDSNGNATKTTYYNADGSINFWYEYEYDTNDILTKEATYDSEGNVKYWEEYGYNSNGNNTKYVKYDSEGDISACHEYEYDSSGNEIKCTAYNSNGDVSYWNEYEYDLNNNMVKETCTHSETGSSWCEYEYDSNGNMIVSIFYNSSGSVVVCCKYEYDSCGNETRRTDYDSDGNATWWREYEYEYDLAGNMVRRVRNSSDDYDHVWSLALGMCIETKIQVVGYEDCLYEYIYNLNGGIVSKTITSYMGGNLYRIEYQSRIN